MKKNMATAMAAAMAFGAVVPAFANTLDAKTEATVNVALANGEITAEVAYDQAYETKFTADKKDDVLRTGVTVLEKLEVNKDDALKDTLLVSIKVTKENFEELKTAKLLNQTNFAAFEADVKNAKLDYQDANSRIENLLKQTFTDKTTGQRKAKYVKTELTKTAISQTIANAARVNYTTVTLEDQQPNGTNLEFVFQNIVVKETASNVKPETIVDFAQTFATDDDRAAEYKKLSKEIIKIENKKDVTIKAKESNSTTLDIEVFKNDAKKTHIETYRIEGFNKFNKYEFTKISGAKSDFAKHWAFDNIFDAMYADKIDNAVNFRPDAGITRAEFAKILVNSFDILESDKTIDAYKNPFKDVKDGSWEYDFVMSLSISGIVDGNGDGTFRPNAPISRQEAAKMVAAVAVKEKKVDKNGKAIAGETFDNKNGAHVDVRKELPFRDKLKVQVWADESVKSLNEAGVITGYQPENNFKPEAGITRAESIVMMEKAANLKTTIK